MKISDLTEKKKGPIVGAPEGSQKDSNMGTDDPSKYMRGGEWEAYHEPQGINSKAGKIASGQKKGTTRTKNKKMTEDVRVEDAFVTANPSQQDIERLIPLAVNRAKKTITIKGLYDPRGTFWAWVGSDDTPHHAEVRSALEDKYDAPEFEDWYDVTYENTVAEGFDEHESKLFFDEVGGFIPYIFDYDSNGNMIHSWAMFPELLELPEVKPFFLTRNTNDVSEGLQPTGPGSSGDIVARSTAALTMSAVADTIKQNRTKGAKLAGSEAPTKLVKKTIKKSMDNRPGNVSDINERVDSIVNEAIPRTKDTAYDATYELRDDDDTETIGVAEIKNGIIETLSVRNDFKQDFEGHIMSRLVSTIINDADIANANLAIVIGQKEQQQKRFLERFGFRDIGDNTMKRNAGSITPPSVPTQRL
jgi:hypothetical protein